MFRADAPDPVEELPEAADFCANMPEGCELVPMHDRPTLQIIRFRRREKPDPEEVRRFVYGLYRRLEEACCMIPQRDDRGLRSFRKKRGMTFRKSSLFACKNVIGV